MIVKASEDPRMNFFMRRGIGDEFGGKLLFYIVLEEAR